jgi:hypothetical protein
MPFITLVLFTFPEGTLMVAQLLPTGDTLR